MDQKNHPRHHPSHGGTHSFSDFQPWDTESFDVKKKRKLLFEQLSLPTPKLPCWGPSSSSISFPYGEDSFKFNKKRPKEGESSLTKMATEGKDMSTEEVRIQGEKDGIKDKLDLNYGHEEDLLEFGSHGNSSIYEHYCSDSTQNLLLPTDSNHDFVLSSGRWSIDPEAESKIITPTIDQEFEQYFSGILPSLDP
ncbi:protein FAR-RED-ELONGATED HYPOCOTYL 1-LIKE-like [Cucurbita moschata]|uniref:Protein FAR-RED-ELONGATED HYPOCOTYL 1-LIKE-like n=1 Tax=Cucurbita moschata TaxID=3662 RepID=A0A6J1GGJ6_CUCMO|nr:protein FAR-RED-ELONGATED HYPOCOTYL 1-LIKE-like [Cucurbita moschata]